MPTPTDRTEFVEFTKPELGLIKDALQTVEPAWRLTDIGRLIVKVSHAIAECERYERLAAETAAPVATFKKPVTSNRGRGLLEGRI